MDEFEENETNSESSVAVCEPVVRPKRDKSRPEGETQTKVQPPWAVIVHNDNDHTMLYVFWTFKQVLGYNDNRCQELVMRVHQEGRAVVWTGSQEVAELKRDMIRGMGPDHFAESRPDYPLQVSIEQLP